MTEKDVTTQRKRLESLRRDRKAGLTTEKDVTTQGKQPETLRRDKERQIYQTYASRRKENSMKLCVVAGKRTNDGKGCHDAGKTAENSAS